MCFKPETVDIRLALTNTPPANGGAVMMRCPFKEKHIDNTYSLAVYPGNVHCHGCGFHLARRYESLAFVLGLWDGRGDGTDAARVGADVAHLFVGRPIGQEQDLQPLNNSIALPYRIHLWGDRPDRLAHFMEWRGVSEETVDRFRIGYDVCGRYVLPVYSACHQLQTLRYRIDDFECDLKYVGMTGRNKTYLYPAWILQERLAMGAVTDLWIVEGELDTLPLWERGIPAITVTNGAGQVPNILALIQAEFGKCYTRIVIATDQDEAGNMAARRLGLGVRAVWGSGKDITEYLRGGGRMEEITYEQFRQDLGGSKEAPPATERPARPRSLLRP